MVACPTGDYFEEPEMLTYAEAEALLSTCLRYETSDDELKEQEPAEYWLYFWCPTGENVQLATEPGSPAVLTISESEDAYIDDELLCIFFGEEALRLANRATLTHEPLPD